MTSDLTIVIPVWDQHTRLLPRCLNTIRAERVDAHVIVVDNASELPVDVPAVASRIALAERRSIGGARNAGLACVTTPYVVFADADDEIVPGSLARSLDLLSGHPRADGVIGRSIVDEDGRYRRRGRTPHTGFRLASRYIPRVAPLFWLMAFQCSITSTVLRTAAVRSAGGIPDTNIAEDWQLAARLAPPADTSSASTNPSAPTTATPTQHATPPRTHPPRCCAAPSAPTPSTTRGTPLTHRLFAHLVRGVAHRTR